MEGVMTGTSEKLIEELRMVVGLRLNEPISRHTTFGIGGPADIYVVADDAAQLKALVTLCSIHSERFFILGAGSNILVSDKGIRGVTIENRARALEGPLNMEDGHVIFRVESGASLAATARDLSHRGFAGLEWAGGIPGTIGGAVVYNASAYDGSMATILQGVSMLSGDGLEYDLAVAELGLGYRESAFTRKLFTGHVIVRASLLLHQADARELSERMEELDRNRQAAQPRGRSAGSIFKNTREYPAWWLIDQVGLRGYRIGDAEFSTKHPNFIVNVGRATAKDVRRLMELAEQRVADEFSIKLLPEVAFVGEDLS
jgi:UDP-N-acetylmuramate dehydrogenase